MQSLALRAPRALIALLGALLLAVSLVVASAGAARADVETSCENRNEDSLKRPPNRNGNGEAVHTVCRSSSAAEEAVPASIPAGSGSSAPVQAVALLGLGLAAAGLAAPRARAGAR